MLSVFSIYEANGQPVLGRGAEVELRGTLGTAYATIQGYEIVPERGGAFQDPKPRRKGLVVKATDGDLDQQARPRLPRLRQGPQAARRRHRGGPPLDHLRPPGEYCAGHPQTTRLGPPGRTLHPLRRGQPAPALRVSQALGPLSLGSFDGRVADGAFDAGRGQRVVVGGLPPGPAWSLVRLADHHARGVAGTDDVCRWAPHVAARRSLHHPCRRIADGPGLRAAGVGTTVAHGGAP